jgi:hypothetical protein
MNPRVGSALKMAHNVGTVEVEARKGRSAIARRSKPSKW